MTRDEILNMEAGRDMDMLIAEKVMGWHKGNYVFSSGKTIGECDDDWLDADGRFMCGIAREGEYEDDEDFNLLHWHPSESILWAWEVVEKLISMKWEFYTERVGVLWWVLFENDCNILDRCAEADTAPLAICRASLLAVMEEK